MTIYPNAGALKVATTQRTALAASKMRLFKDTGFIPGPGTVTANLAAIEADFSGYPAGGITVANFQNPLIQPAGGAGIDSGIQQFAWVDPTPPDEPVPNMVKGWFVVDAAGVTIATGTFPNPVAVAAPGQGVPINVQLVFGTPVN